MALALLLMVASPASVAQPQLDGLEQIEVATVEALDQQGLLVDHDFTGYDDSITVAIYVKRGSGQQVLDLLKRKIDEAGLRDKVNDIVLIREEVADLIYWDYDT